MGEGLRMVHLRTVPDAWHAKVLAARLGCEGIVTHLQGNLSGPYPFGAVSVLVEEGQAELAAELLLADEVEAAFSGPGAGHRASGHPSAAGFGAEADGDETDDAINGPALALSLLTWPGTDDELDRRPRKTWRPWQRAVAATAAVLVAGAPVLAHFVG